ncbi:hypothetical protein OJAV_G00195420 [Oryzias javanicus]|uniref:Uncharacterized protein n=1 Tax=Oryzias javanicus TaxID=123683 RepID=A0A437C7U3_ORYJA|nr:hypothetical protein OJAV_G00195420 [Oryzias javanicus]
MEVYGILASWSHFLFGSQGLICNLLRRVCCHHPYSNVNISVVLTCSEFFNDRTMKSHFKMSDFSQSISSEMMSG